MPMNDYAQGNFQTETFANTFKDASTFEAKWAANPLSSIAPATITTAQLDAIFYLLYARYGNSHFATWDQNQAEYQIFSAIVKYAPTWIKRYAIQKELVTMADAELLDGAKTIYNHALNPATSATTEELDQIDDQNTAKQKRSKLDAYEYLASLLDDRLTDSFLEKFKNLFLKVVEPNAPIWYGEEI
jgi:hypothetical protein